MRFKQKIEKNKVGLFLIFSIALIGIFGLAESSWAAEHYVRPDATGDNNGTDWNNAWNALPPALARGDVYYLADGSYSSYTFDTADSGSVYVYIKKATAASHGTNTGWQNSYGDGVAEFTQLLVSTNYLDFDGVTGGGPDSWTTGHGIAFNHITTAGKIEFIVVGGTTGVRIRHISATETGNNVQPGDTFGASGIVATVTNGSDAVADLLVEYSYFDNLVGLPFFFREGSGVVLQYNYTGDVCGGSTENADWHCEALVTHGLDQIDFRYNFINESPSSGGFVKNDTDVATGVRIYGNIMGNGFPIQCNTGTCVDWRIFNNTFIHLTSGPIGGDGTRSGWLIYNNINWDNPSAVNPSYPPGSYSTSFAMASSYCESTQDASSYGFIVRYPNDCDSSDPAYNRNPFTDSANNDFSLVSAEAAGFNVCNIGGVTCDALTPYNADLRGEIRTNWSRGAYEYTATPSPDSTPPTVTVFTIPSTATSLTVPITTFTADDNTAVTGYLLNESAATPSVDDANWSGTAQSEYAFATEGLKTLYAWAKDAADNISESLSANVTITLSSTSSSVLAAAEDDDDSGGGSKKKKKAAKSRTISVSKKSIARGGTIIERGKKFSKNSLVLLYFSRPGGGYYPPQKIMTSAAGSFISTYRFSYQEPVGIHSWYAVDVKTGKRSKTLIYRIK